MKVNRIYPILLVVILLLPFRGLLAQRQNDNWYFADSAAMNFNGGSSPTEVTGTCVLSSANKNYVSVSDKSTGKLLFYSDGLTVWNNLNVVMDNGSNIFNPAVCDYVIYCPNPANTSQYFVFSYTGRLISYAVVDMSMNGGLGKVISTNNVLTQFATRKFTIARHGTYDSYWLIALRGSNGNDTFDCFPITTAGIQTPIRSIMGFNNGVFAYMSEMVTNPAGDKIVVTNYSDTKPEVTIYDFSKNCGTVSTPKQIPVPSLLIFPKSPVFSPDGSKLYVSYIGSGYNILQYSGTDFQNQQYIYISSVGSINDMELGPDGMIYVAKGQPDKKKLDIIITPNSSVVGYTYNSFTLSHPVAENFPTFIHDVSTPGVQQKNPVITITNTCYKDTTLFTPSNMPLLDSLDWEFGNTLSPNNTSKLDIPTHIYTDTGTYTVTLSWYNCGVKSSAYKQVQIISVSNLKLGPDSTLCADDTLILTSPLKNLDLTWSTGSKDSAITITKAGTYSLIASAGPRCSSADTIVISYYPKLTVDFFDSTYFVCENANETVNLYAGSDYISYLWLPGGETTQSIVATLPQWYFVEVTNNKGCKANDSVLVNSQCDNSFYIPNAFTPNNDGKNDTFAPVFNDVFNYRLEIYSRWGEKVFESTNPKTGWDGTYKNNACEAGAYIWRLSYQGNKYKIVRTYTQKGVVNLLR